MPDTALDDDALVELAERLRGAETGGWTEKGVRGLAGALGWEPADGAPTRLRTGLPTGEARLRPVDRLDEDYTRGERHLGLYVPVALVDGGAAAKADAFARAARALTAKLGPAPIMGAHGDPGPFYESTASWGSPFLRWRGRPDSLELRAGDDGPELLLHPSDPVENWHWRQGHGEAYALGGFFGARPDPANAGLGHPGGWTTGDWDVFATALGGFLGCLAAETRALGIELSLGMHGRIPGTHGPWVFHIASAQTLELAVYEETVDTSALDMAALGWTPVSEAPAAMDHLIDVSHHTGAFAPGEADGRGLARTLVETAKALGIPSPRGLSLIDHCQSVAGYRVDYYGLTLKENP
ncbi:hypothetical protein [Nocardiopsis potens]|uniref:hypothetical protein n=1 Tax=Nocardiopsis potens TaxID=1246458 RepID=UPI00034C248D|nr:hypothetical protein [Nocardiopsis potens]